MINGVPLFDRSTTKKKFSIILEINDDNGREKKLNLGLIGGGGKNREKGFFFNGMITFYIDFSDCVHVVDESSNIVDLATGDLATFLDEKAARWRT